MNGKLVDEWAVDSRISSALMDANAYPRHITRGVPLKPPDVAEVIGHHDGVEPYLLISVEISRGAAK